MNISIIWENPGLTTLALLGAIFVFLVMQKLAAPGLSRAQTPNAHDDRYRDDEMRRSSEDDRRSAPRARPARAGWFISGVCVGAAGMALLLNPAGVSNLLTQLTQLVSPYISAVTTETPESTPPKMSDNPGPLNDDTLDGPMAAGDTSDIDAMVAAFVADLRAKLPVTVSPGIIMAIVESEKDLIALGFVISRVVANADEPQLQRDLEARFRDSVCATKPSPANLHGLNDLGVTLLINYADLSGKNVAALTVEPGFCSDADSAEDRDLPAAR